MIDTRITQDSFATRLTGPRQAWFEEAGATRGRNHPDRGAWQSGAPRRIRWEYRECG